MSKFVTVLTLAAALTATAPLQAETAKTPTNKQIRDYLLNNGDVILQGIQRFQQAEQQRQAAAVIRADTPVTGALDSPITLIEFSDFECPYCQAVQPTLDEIKKRYQSRIRIAYKHIPLGFHAKAPAAAMASMAAQEQGKFWEFSRQLYARQAMLGDDLYEKIAEDLNLDLKAFNTYRNSAQAKARLAQDMLDAETVGVRGTPFFLINGTPLSGAQPLAAFVAEIEKALNQQQTKADEK